MAPIPAMSALLLAALSAMGLAACTKRIAPAPAALLCTPLPQDASNSPSVFPIVDRTEFPDRCGFTETIRAAPSGRLIAFGCDDVLGVWAIGSDAPYSTRAGSSKHGHGLRVSFTPDESLVAFGLADGIWIYEADEFKLVTRIAISEYTGVAPHNLEFSADGSCIIAENPRSGERQSWRLPDGAPAGREEFDPEWQFRIDPQFTLRRDPLRLENARTGHEHVLIERGSHVPYIRSAHVNPLANLVAIAFEPGYQKFPPYDATTPQVRVWDMRTNALVAVIEGPEWRHWSAGENRWLTSTLHEVPVILPDARYVVCISDRWFRLIDIEIGREVARDAYRDRLKRFDQPTALGDGSRVAGVGAGGIAVIQPTFHAEE